MTIAALERIEGLDVRRTGFTTGARRCPVHGERLELCFDETDYSTWSADHQVPFHHDDNRVRWRCAACVGSWLENYFLAARAEAPSPPRLLLGCPRCSSRRVTHECVPACCGAHVCVDCGGRFELAVEVVTPGDGAGPEPPPAPSDVILSTPSPAEAVERSGWWRPFRVCPVHALPLELVFIPVGGGAAAALLAWRCDPCARSWTEASFRRHHRQFAPDASPGAVCPVCRSESVENAGAGGDLATCRRCRSTLRLRLEPSGDGR
jgi:Zn finger protein HypA/HybF involved in hydrogenase expression